MTRKHLKAASHALACALAIGLGMNAAQAALGKCRNDGFQVTVAAVDRSGIGVSGAPGGDRDEACARAGIAAIQDSIDF